MPGNSTIVFEVELLDFRFYDKTDDKHGGVMFCRRFKKGSGDFYPTDNSIVCCDLSSYNDYNRSQTMFGDVAAVGDNFPSSGMMGLFDVKDDEHYEDNYNINEKCCEEIDDGYRKMAKIYTRKDMTSVTNEMTLLRDPSFKYIDKKKITWTLGEGDCEQIPKGVEIAIKSMLVGEKSLFMVRYDYLKDMLTDEEYEKYKNDSQFYMFIITLRSCIKAKECNEMSIEERLEEAHQLKLQGKHYLTEELNVELALKRYKRAIDLLETSINLDGDNRECDELLLSCCLNISRAYFDINAPELCEEYLNKALKIKPNNEKAMYRFGVLLMQRKKYKEAQAHFENLLEHYSTNEAAIQLVKECEYALESSVLGDLYEEMGKKADS